MTRRTPTANRPSGGPSSGRGEFHRPIGPLLGLAIATLSATVAHSDIQHHDWCRITTPDFDLVSDLSSRSASALAEQMTRFTRATEMLLPQQASRGPALEVIAFRRTQDFRRVLGLRNVTGLTLPSLERYTLVFGPERGRGQSRPLTAWHGYAHYLLRSSRRINHPAWYEVGFANFLSTIYHTKDGIVIGNIPATHRLQMSRLRPALAGLIDGRLKTDSAHRASDAGHLQAWLLVHMLHLGHLAGLPAFHEGVPQMLTLIDAGETPAAAIEEALGVDVADLQGFLKLYRRRHSLPTATLAVDMAPETPPAVHCLDSRDTRRLLASAASDTGNDGYARDLFEQMLDENPDDVDALVGLSGVSEERGAALEAVRRALRLDADHPGANVRMAELTSDQCLRETPEQCVAIWRKAAEHYSRALREHPDHVEAIFDLGLAYLYARRFPEAVAQLQVAHELAPWMPRVNLFLGEAYRYAGDAARARPHLRQAMHWHFNQRWRDHAAASLAALETPAGD